MEEFQPKRATPFVANVASRALVDLVRASPHTMKLPTVPVTTVCDARHIYTTYDASRFLPDFG